MWNLKACRPQGPNRPDGLGHSKGSKNHSIILREAQETVAARGLLGHEQEFLDSLHVMEQGMRYFYVRAVAAKRNGLKQEIVDAAFRDAVAIAEKVARYRHARLSAMKLAGDPNNPVRIKDDATLKELRADMMKHLGILIDCCLVDLEALPVPNRGIANQPSG
jgi:hypothetical protein